MGNTVGAGSVESFMAAWERAGLGPRALEAGAGTIVVLQRGARVVPFDESGTPLLWLSPQVLPEADVVTWSHSGAWNLGAERMWLGPEWRLMVEDRADFQGTYALHPAMDPGAWRLEEAPHGVSLVTDMHMLAHQPEARLALRVAQSIVPERDPARRWPEADGLRHVGWSREVELTRDDRDEGSVACQAWLLAQVEAPATVFVPHAGTAAVTDYFEPVDPRHMDREPDALRFSLSGRQRYKVGIRTGEHRGLIAALRELPEGQASLIVRWFLDTPSTRYLKEPPHQPGHEGDSLYVYNDDGRFGHFGEIEALGRALEPDARSVRDRFELHAWWGDRSALARLAARILRTDVAAWNQPLP